MYFEGFCVRLDPRLLVIRVKGVQGCCCGALLWSQPGELWKPVAWVWQALEAQEGLCWGASYAPHTWYKKLDVYNRQSRRFPCFISNPFELFSFWAEIHEKASLRCKNSDVGVPWWLSGLSIQHCHCCGTGSIPGPGIFACWVPPKKNLWCM